MGRAAKPCSHTSLVLEPSAFATEAGYVRPNASQRLKATTKLGKLPSESSGAQNDGPGASEDDHIFNSNSTFPGPLILPDDDLALTPKYPPQSLRSWIRGEWRNKVTAERKTLYVATITDASGEMAFMNEWLHPNLEPTAPPPKKRKVDPSPPLDPPELDHFIMYLKAFYHGLPVKPIPQPLRFVPWSDPVNGPQSTNPKYVGLAYGNDCTRIRARPSPDGIFKGQLNLGDILYATMEMLPDDAYSIVVLVNQDMYEDEEDEFCCGRAYGGSRVCVVSTARYHPALDDWEGLNLQHMWPASHCRTFVDGMCRAAGMKLPRAGKVKLSDKGPSPMQLAVNTSSRAKLPKSPTELRALWFSRLARTVAHELGHCFGMDHCVYYACMMQGTAGMAEDVRQPPYLCPVCLNKLIHGIAVELQAADDKGIAAYTKERYQVLLDVCTEWSESRNAMLMGYEAWLRGRIGQLDLELQRNGSGNPIIIDYSISGSDVIVID